MPRSLTASPSPSLFCIQIPRTSPAGVHISGTSYICRGYLNASTVHLRSVAPKISVFNTHWAFLLFLVLTSSHSPSSSLTHSLPFVSFAVFVSFCPDDATKSSLFRWILRFITAWYVCVNVVHHLPHCILALYLLCFNIFLFLFSPPLFQPLPLPLLVLLVPWASFACTIASSSLLLCPLSTFCCFWLILSVPNH